MSSYSQLQRQTGDQQPYLDVFQKIAKAIHENRPPFDGACQQCGKQTAAVKVPVTFQYLVKRDVSDREGIQPGVGGLSLVVGAATEYWRTIHFPLLHCADCQAKFTADWTRSTRYQVIKAIVGLLIATPLLLILLLFLFIAPFISVPGIMLILGMMYRFHTRKKVDPFVLFTLQRLPLIGEAISAEDEYEIQLSSETQI